MIHSVGGMSPLTRVVSASNSGGHLSSCTVFAYTMSEFPPTACHNVQIRLAAFVQTPFLQRQKALIVDCEHTWATRPVVSSHRASDESTGDSVSPAAPPHAAPVLLRQRCRCRDTIGTSVCSDFPAPWLAGHPDGQRDLRETSWWSFRPPPSASPNDAHAGFPGNVSGVLLQDRKS